MVDWNYKNAAGARIGDKGYAFANAVSSSIINMTLSSLLIFD